MRFTPSPPVLVLAIALASIGVLPIYPQVGSFREAGAIYLEDSMDKLPRLKVLQNTAVFADSAGSRHVGILPAGSDVQLQAVGERLYRVKGRALHGDVVGWVQPQFVTPLSADFLEALKRDAERRAEVAQLIERNEVAVGMTTDEVRQSLGKPEKRTAQMDATQRFDVWEYIRYERQPRQVQERDRLGRLFWNTVYVKVPVGRLAVVFEDDIVTQVEQTEDNSRPSAGRVVVEPLELTW